MIAHVSNLLAWVLGWLWWTVIPARKKEAIANYTHCFPERDPSELRQGIGELAVQYFDMLIGRRATIENWEIGRKGGLCIAGHFGAWDIALTSLSTHVPVSIFVKTPSNPIAARLVMGMRGRFSNLELINATASLKPALEALDRGRLVLMVQDQRFNRGIPVDFFGKTCLTSPGFAMLAWKKRPPLIGFYQWREGGKHYGRLEPLAWPISEVREDALQELTAQTQEFYERKIGLRPYAWLWLHRRWRMPNKN